MSTPKRPDPGSLALDHVVREARTALQPPASGPEPRWDEIERRLLARVETERARQHALARFGGSRRVWGVTSAIVAAAAAAVLFVGGSEKAKEANFDAIGPQRAEPTALLGEVFEASASHAVFETTGGASWMLEPGSRVQVTSVAPLVLRLERGAVEADVTPVPSGEAFAVDIDRVRVAVHGTHLRVARDGDRVTVDLSEGVVSIGEPPRVGSTYGRLVVARAHATFSTSDVDATLTVSHDPANLRAPVALGPFAEAPPAPAPSVAALNPGVVAAPAAPPRATLASSLRAPQTPQPAAPAAAGPDLHPADTLAAAVRACAAGAPHSAEVKVTVSSALELRVGDDGYVKSARFDPPLAPEIQTCAATTIYHVRFAEPGARTIPIVLER